MSNESKTASGNGQSPLPEARCYAAVEWLNQQNSMTVYVATMLVGPKVRIFEGHRMVATGETIQEAIEKIMPQPHNAKADTR